MPRYYRRRSTRIVRPKKKWASNMRSIYLTPIADPNAPEVAFSDVLCANATEVDAGGVVTPTPTIVKTGNFKVQCDCSVIITHPGVVQAMMYVLYIPEGVFTPNNPAADYTTLGAIITRHPEWILSWRQFSSDAMDTRGNLERVSFSSRLKRNLNSGDKVYVVLLVNVVQSLTPVVAKVQNVICRGMAQFWTCAN